MSTPDVDVDVVVLGAGAAGLAAAGGLICSGHKCIVLEARSRIGGRIFTARDPLSPIPVEMGAEFIHGKLPALWDLLHDHALAACDVQQSHLCYSGGRLGPCDQATASFGRIMERGLPDPDCSFEELLERSKEDASTRQWAAAYVEGFNAADKSRVSAQALFRQTRAEEEAGGGVGFRLPAGYDCIPRALLARVPLDALRLNCVAKGIVWSRGQVRVSIESPGHDDLGSIAARAAVVTLPLSILQEQPTFPGGVRFDPEPADNLAAANRIVMGHAAHITLRFRDCFWESRPELQDFGFIHSLEPWFPTWWSKLPFRVPLLTGWMGGPKTEKLAGCGEPYALERALETLGTLLDTEPAQLRSLLAASYFHDWSSDPFARGAYTYLTAGHVDAPERLAKPVEGTLFFAGEATENSGHYGTVHGAIASGLRAAREANEQL